MLEMKTQLPITTFLLSVSSLTSAKPIPTLNTAYLNAAPLATTGSVTAVGIGITSLDVSNKFYSSVFGFSKGSRMSFSGWDEDIMQPPRGGGPALVPMKFKTGGGSPLPERSVKDLPVKLTFTTGDARALVAKVVAAGGKAVEGGGGGSGKEGVLYAKDPDGYLLEIVPGGSGSGVAFSAVGYGSSDPTKSAQFFSRLAGTTPGQLTKSESSWDTVVVPTKKKFEVLFLDFKDQRPTKKLPLKIVWGVPSIPGFKKTITENGGSLVEKGMGVMGAFVGLGYDSVDQIMIEINSGAG